MYVFFSLNTAVTFSSLSLAANLDYWLKLYWTSIIKSMLKVHVYVVANEYFILMYTVFWNRIVFTEGISVVNVCDKITVSFYHHLLILLSLERIFHSKFRDILKPFK